MDEGEDERSGDQMKGRRAREGERESEGGREGRERPRRGREGCMVSIRRLICLYSDPWLLWWRELIGTRWRRR